MEKLASTEHRYSASDHAAGKWRDILIAAAVLCLCLVGAYRDVVFGGKTFLALQSAAGTMPQGAWNYQSKKEIKGHPSVDPGTGAWMREPEQYYTRSALAAGELPYWNPHAGMGQPLLASGSSAVFDPLTWPGYLCSQKLWPLLMDLEILCRFFLAGFFMFLFLRECGLGIQAALLGGCLVILSNSYVNFGPHQMLRVHALAPLLLYSFERLFSRPGRLSFGMASFASCWVLLADFAESSFVVFMLGALWYVFRVVASRKVEVNAGKGGVLRPLFRLFAVLIVGFCLAGPWLLPFLNNVSASFSRHGAGAVAGGFSWPLSFLPHLLLPYETRDHMWSIFSATALVLAVFAFGKNADRERALFRYAAFFAVFLFVWVLKSFSCPLVAWLGRLPVFEQVWLIREMPPLLEVCLVAVAAFGVNKIITERRDGIRYIVLAVLAVLAFMGVSLIFADWHELGESKKQMGRFLKSFWIVSGFALALGGAIYASVRFKLRNWALFALLLLLIFGESFWRQRKFERCVRQNPYDKPPYMEFLDRQPKPFRVFGRERILFPNIAQVYGVDDLRYNTALDSPRRMRLLQTFVCPERTGVALNGDERYVWVNSFMDLLNVKYVLSVNSLEPDASNLGTGLPSGKASYVPWLLSPKPLADNAAGEASGFGEAVSGLGGAGDGKSRFECVYDKEIKIYENRRVLPRAFMVYNAIRVSGVEDALKIMQSPGFDVVASAVVECDKIPDDFKLAGAGDSANPPARVEFVGRSANSRQLKVSGNTLGLLVWSQTYSRDWSVWVDGKPATLYPVDVALCGVFVGPGEHEIRFRYFPKAFRYGLISFAAGLVLLVGLVILSVKPSAKT